MTRRISPAGVLIEVVSKIRQDEIQQVVEWLRALPEEWIHDWGLNATAEIADMLESGRWQSTEAAPLAGTEGKEGT